MVPLAWKRMKIKKGYAKMSGNMKNYYLQRTGREITSERSTMLPF